MRRLCTLCLFVSLITSFPIAAKDDKKKKNTDGEVSEWARRTEGHKPQDQNGDGRISRNEWPGNDESFRRLDRNSDGVITSADRKLQSKSRPVDTGDRGKSGGRPTQ